MRGIWRKLIEVFQSSERKLRVARLLLEHGLRIDENGNIKLGEIKIPYSSVAQAAGVDRRTVTETIKKIMNDPELYEVYRKMLSAGPSLKEVAKTLNLRVLTIEVYHDQPGIIAHVSKILSKNNINILQVIAEYPELFDNPKLYIVIEGNIQGDLIEEIMSHGAIKSVKIN